METSTIAPTAMRKIELPPLQAKRAKITVVDQPAFAGAGQVTNIGIAISGLGENQVGLLESRPATTKSGGRSSPNIWVNKKLDLGIIGLSDSYREAPTITQAIISARNVSPMEQ